jgi:hypothetical protein
MSRRVAHLSSDTRTTSVMMPRQSDAPVLVTALPRPTCWIEHEARPHLSWYSIVASLVLYVYFFFLSLIFIFIFGSSQDPLYLLEKVKIQNCSVVVPYRTTALEALHRRAHAMHYQYSSVLVVEAHLLYVV